MEGKWSQWSSLLTEAGDAPQTSTAARKVAVPAITAVVCAVLLLCVAPPFVCDDKMRISGLKLGIWVLLAAVATAALTAKGVFARYGQICE